LLCNVLQIILKKNF